MGRRTASATAASLFMIVALVAAEEHLLVPTVICGATAIGFAVTVQRLHRPPDI